MILSPEATQVLYANGANESGQTLSEQLHDAYRRNVDDGLAVPSAETTAQVAAKAIAQAAQRPDQPHPGVGNLHPEAYNLVNQAVDRASELFTWLPGLKVPSVSELETAGLDLTYFKEAYNEMETEGKEPELLLVPHLSVEQWKTLYQRLQDDPTVNSDGRIKNGGLAINGNVAKEWDDISKPPTPTGSPVYSKNPYDTEWHLSVVPGTDRPTKTNVDHGNPAYSSTHPTVNDYLTLQAGRLQRGEPPVDSDTWTWLKGIGYVPMAPWGCWYPGDGKFNHGWYTGSGQVSLNEDVFNTSDNGLGVRPAVR